MKYLKMAAFKKYIMECKEGKKHEGVVDMREGRLTHHIKPQSAALCIT